MPERLQRELTEGMQYETGAHERQPSGKGKTRAEVANDMGASYMTVFKSSF